jgi:DNA polymerase III subunit delta'
MLEISAMGWHGIVGHDDVVEQFRRALTRERLASSFLFAGPEGIGKRTFAVKLAQTLLCRTRPEAAMDPCGHCPPCQQVIAGTHPDLEIVAKPADKSLLPIDLFIGDKVHRMREGLCHNIAMKPFLGGHKVAIIDDADWLNAEGANCLLKTLEEPPPRSVLILIGTSPAKQLPTIRSRCQLIRFRPLATDAVAELLVARGLVADAAQARHLAAHAGGSLGRAVELSDPELWQFRTRLHEMLGAPRLDSVRLAIAVNQFVEQAGKEPASRRARLRQVIGFGAEFYERALRSAVGGEPRGAADRNVLPPGGNVRPPVGPDAAARCLDRSLEAASHVDRNVHLTTLVECWLDDLGKAGNSGVFA